jgi:hypothetical protein
MWIADLLRSLTVAVPLGMQNRARKQAEQVRGFLAFLHRLSTRAAIRARNHAVQLK